MSVFTSDYLSLPSGRRIFYVRSVPAICRATPVVAIHGLGGSSSYWLPALQASGLATQRAVYAYDMDGHGLSNWSGRDDMTIEDYAKDLGEFLARLKLDRVVLVGHSMNGMVTSVFTEANPDVVEKLVLLHPVRNFGPPGQAVMRSRAKASSSVEGLSAIANGVAAGAMSKVSSTDVSLAAFVRSLVSTTNPAGYAAACRAIAGSKPVDGTKLPCPLYIVGGAEDYLAGPDAVRAWAAEVPNGRGQATVLEDVGHWGAVEAPALVGAELSKALCPDSYDLIMGTFRSPYLYSLRFDVASRKLQLLETNAARGGHSWLDVSADGRTLYTTGWSDPPTVSSYPIERSGKAGAPATVDLAKCTTVESKFLSGYVCSNEHAMYSACGPQVDVFLLNADGSLKADGAAVQSFSLVSEEDRHKGADQMDFGGLRHGGHSCDLSPDGTKLYVADIGRNCVWLYHVDRKTGLLTEASKNVATRPDDGPRHVWPHPNGRLVYSLQEHTSMVDVFALSPDGGSLSFIEGASILPPGDSAKLYWADEVRLSPRADVVFGSTRGLEPTTKGWVTAWRLQPSGHLAPAASPAASAKANGTSNGTANGSSAPDLAAHRYETRTSGGWANAIAVAPQLGPRGEVFLTLTDSEEGFIQMLAYTDDAGFELLDEVKIGSANEQVGASVAVWL